RQAGRVRIRPLQLTGTEPGTTPHVGGEETPTRGEVMLKLFATTAAVALLAFGGPSLAQTAPSTQRPAAGTAMPSGTTGAQAKQGADRGERKFMGNGAHGNAKEIALGKIAQQKSQHPQVKQLAETIVRDHTEAGEKLKPIAASMGVDLSEAMAEGQKDDVDD